MIEVFLIDKAVPARAQRAFRKENGFRPTRNVEPDFSKSALRAVDGH
jgi:hypothetical protein